MTEMNLFLLADSVGTQPQVGLMELWMISSHVTS